MPKHRDIDPKAKRRNRLDHVAQDGTAYVDGTIERLTSKAATKAYRDGWERTFKRGGSK